MLVIEFGGVCSAIIVVAPAAAGQPGDDRMQWTRSAEATSMIR